MTGWQGLNNLCQPLTGNDKTGYTILYTAKNEIYRKQATVHEVIVMNNPAVGCPQPTDTD